MGRLIEQQAVIDCLTNTAKYYDMPQADEWTKGIHYGLLHGVDNILDNVPPVEAIPKAEYETRLKADMVAMLEGLQQEIEEKATQICDDGWWLSYNWLIQQKINELKGVQDED